jgi:hypothetical protein
LYGSILPVEHADRKIELLCVACDRLEIDSNRASSLDAFRDLIGAYLLVNKYVVPLAGYDAAAAANSCTYHLPVGLHCIGLGSFQCSYESAIATIERIIPFFEQLKQPHNVYKSYRDIFIIHLCTAGPEKAESIWHHYSGYVSSRSVLPLDENTNSLLVLSLSSETPEFGRSSESNFCSKILDIVQFGTIEELAKCIEYEMCSIRIPGVARLLQQLKPLGRERETFTFTSDGNVVSTFADGAAGNEGNESDDGC